MQMREKVGKSRNTVFLQWFVAPESWKVGSLKRRVRSQLARWEMKNCTPLWREAHFQVKMYKTQQVRTTFGGSDVASLHYTTLHYTTLHYATLHYTTLHYTTLHYTTLQLQLHNYTPLHEIKLHYTTLHYTTLHSTTPHYTTVHYTTLQNTEWHCTTDR